MAFSTSQLHELRRRARDWTRARAAQARARLEPARARAAAWAATPAVAEARPRLPGKPDLAAKIAAATSLALIAGGLVFLAVVDWNLLREPIGRWASDRWDRPVVLAGDLEVDLFRWSPKATINDLRIGPPAWGPRRDTARVEQLAVSAKALSLLAGDLDMPEVRIVRPRLFLLVDEQGRKTWQLGPDTGKPPQLPLMRRLLIEDGQIEFSDVRRRLKIEARVNSSETPNGGPESAFRLEGRGTLNANPLSLTIAGGSLVNVRRDRPYRFTADLRGGATTLTARGAITRPFDLGRFTADLTATGPDLADIYDLTTVPAPNTPPYRLRGRLSRSDKLWRFNDFSGRIGDSDIAGDLSVRTGEPRPHLEATLRSRSLDLDDLYTVVGAAPGTGQGETASPDQRALASHLRAEARILPDSRLDVKRLRAMDADVSFRAGSVKVNRIQLRGVHVEARLKDAVLRLQPFDFTFSRGRLGGTVRIDGGKATPFTSTDLTLTGYPLSAVIPPRGGVDVVSGPLNARIKLAGSGASLHEAASNASGSVRLSTSGGQMRQAFAELMGVNVGKGLSLLLSKDGRETPIRCAVADFRAQGGVLRAERLVIDTGVVLATGTGTLNLATERMHLEIDGESKKPRLLRLWAPITIDGPLRSPRLGVKKTEVVKQGAAALVLGAVASPLAAILPFLEPGGAKDVNCARLLGV